MKHKSAKELFRDTQELYNKVEKIAIKQLKIDGKLNDPAITNSKSEFYMDPQAFAMKEYAFFLCFNCKEPYFYGANECGDNEEKLNENNIESRLCSKCYERKLQKIRKRNEKEFEKWKLKKNVRKCPSCSRDIQKADGCDHMTCICGSHWCWICGKDEDVNGKKFDHVTIYPHIYREHQLKNVVVHNE